jgi:peptide/nickel transport system substrate-binding protein
MAVVALLLLGIVVACAGGTSTVSQAPQQPAAAAQPQPAAPAADPVAPGRSSLQTIQPKEVQAPAKSDAASSALTPQFGGILTSVSKRMPSCLYFQGKRCVVGGLKTTVLPLWEGIIDYQYTAPGLPTRGVGKYRPQLAESWKLVGSKTYEFTLRKGVKWHDGTAFTSKDVVWSLNHWGDKVSHGRLRTVFSTFEKIEAMGDYGVRVTLKKASPYFFNTITGIEPRIMAAHIAERAGNPTGEGLIDAYHKNPIGTGPFKLRFIDKTAQVMLERYEDYWGGRPYLDGMRILFVKDTSAWQAAFAVKKIDYVTLNDKIQADTLLRHNPDVAAINYHITSLSSTITFNLNQKPFDDPRVRKAIDLAIDRQGLIDGVTFGQGYATLTPVSPGLTQTGWGVPHEEYITWPGIRSSKAQDIAEAKRLLAEAGYAGGFEVVLKIDRGSSQPSTLAEPLAGQLKAIGLNVKVQPLEPATFYQEVELNRDFGMKVGGGGGSDATSIRAMAIFHTDGPDNIYGIDDPQLNAYLEAAVKELDAGKRNDLYKKIQQNLYDNTYVVSTVNLAKFQLWQPWLREFYGSFASNPIHQNSVAYWLELDKLPSDRQSW